MKTRNSQFLVAVAASLLAVAGVRAQLAMYTFESAVFVPAETTPILNRPPQPGPASFLASFTAAASANLFEIANWFQSSPISGFSIVAKAAMPLSPLTVTVSTPINAVWLGFYMLPAGRLDFTSASGTTSAFTGAGSPKGSLFFSSATPFSQFTIEAFDHYGANGPLPFGVDNLQMQLVPEPAATSLIVALGVLGTAVWWRRRDHTARYRANAANSPS